MVTSFGGLDEQLHLRRVTQVSALCTVLTSLAISDKTTAQNELRQSGALGQAATRRNGATTFFYRLVQVATGIIFFGDFALVLTSFVVSKNYCIWGGLRKCLRLSTGVGREVETSGELFSSDRRFVWTHLFMVST
jgi:hypothetical protein